MENVLIRNKPRIYADFAFLVIHSCTMDTYRPLGYIYVVRRKDRLDKRLDM